MTYLLSSHELQIVRLHWKRFRLLYKLFLTITWLSQTTTQQMEANFCYPNASRLTSFINPDAFGFIFEKLTLSLCSPPSFFPLILPSSHSSAVLPSTSLRSIVLGEAGLLVFTGASRLSLPCLLLKGDTLQDQFSILTRDTPVHVQLYVKCTVWIFHIRGCKLESHLWISRYSFAK